MERPTSRRPLPERAWALALSILLLAGMVAAQRPDEAPGEVRAVVQSQIQALAAEDARQAFELADPQVRAKFGSAQAFMEMLRAEYPMIQHPASMLFMAPEADGGVAFQRVRLTDARGSTWMLTYLLSRDDQNHWRISACMVAPDKPVITV